MTALPLEQFYDCPLSLPKESQDDPEHDLSCLIRQEIKILVVLQNKIAAANPWMLTIFHHELAEGQKLMDQYE